MIGPVPVGPALVKPRRHFMCRHIPKYHPSGQSSFCPYDMRQSIACSEIAPQVISEQRHYRFLDIIQRPRVPPSRIRIPSSRSAAITLSIRRLLIPRRSAMSCALIFGLPAMRCSTCSSVFTIPFPTLPASLSPNPTASGREIPESSGFTCSPSTGLPWPAPVHFFTMSGMPPPACSPMLTSVNMAPSTMLLPYVLTKAETMYSRR